MSTIILTLINDSIALVTSAHRSLHIALSAQPPVYPGAPA